MNEAPSLVEGQSLPRFAPLRALFEQLLRDGDDVGASLAVTIDGEPVVDLWGGWCDETRTTRWTRDTLTHVWSTTKTMVSLLALYLIDRGELDPERPVAHYWPQFAAAGKASIKVHHLLTHGSGLSGWAAPVTVADLCDWDRSTALLAAQEPWWAPGTASGYHALNYGHLLGEVMRRITGLKPGALLRRELAGPLGADFHIGLPDGAGARVARVIPPPPLQLDPGAMPPGSPAFRTFSNPAPDATVSWDAAWCAADIGAANGHGNARSVARLQSLLSCGGELDGRRWLAPATIERVFECRIDGIDLVLGAPLRLGLGWGLPQPRLLPFIPAGRVAFWGGWGGSIVVADADRRICIAYVMNKMAPGIIGGPNAARLVAAAYAALEG